MDENEVVASGTERLDKLEDDIQHGRQHLKDMTHVGEPYLYEDDERTEAQRQSDAERPPADADEAADKEAPPEGPAAMLTRRLRLVELPLRPA
jgi:hypothetical protein